MRKIIRLKAKAVGFACAGKTCMLITLNTKKFPEGYIPTEIGPLFDIVDEGMHIELWDTHGGGIDYDRLRPTGYPGTDVFILCFDVSMKDQFAELENFWYSELRHHCFKVPIILTATKIDLRETEKKCVTTDEGEALAAKTGSHYAEISSLKGIGLDELFKKVGELSSEFYIKKKRKKCAIL